MGLELEARSAKAAKALPFENSSGRRLFISAKREPIDRSHHIGIEIRVKLRVLATSDSLLLDDITSCGDFSRIGRAKAIGPRYSKIRLNWGTTKVRECREMDSNLILGK